MFMFLVILFITKLYSRVNIFQHINNVICLVKRYSLGEGRGKPQEDEPFCMREVEPSRHCAFLPV